MIRRKPPTKRLVRMVGPDVDSPEQPLRPGRPRKHVDNATKARASRLRLRLKQELPKRFLLAFDLLNPDWHAESDELTVEIIEAALDKIVFDSPEFLEVIETVKEVARRSIEKQIEQELSEINAVHPSSSGQFIRNAPTGKGKLISGGYDSEKVSFIYGIREAIEQLGGRKVKGQGASLSRHEDTSGNARSKQPKSPTFVPNFGKLLVDVEKVLNDLVDEWFEKLDSAATSVNFNPELAAYDQKPPSFRCKITAHNVVCGKEFDWRRECRTHIEVEHGALLEQEIKKRKPK